MTFETDREQPLAEITLTRRVVLEWTVLGLGITVVAAVVFAAIYAFGTGQTDIEFRIGGYESALVGFGWLVLSVVAVLAVHEAIHAAVIRRYGGDVSFGVGLARFVLPYAYVTTTQRLERDQFVVVALAPLVLITLVGVPLVIVLDAPILVGPLALNAGGAIGDLWMAAILLRYPPHVVVEDSKTGVRLYGNPDDEPPAVTERGLSKRIVLGTGFGFVFVIVSGVVVPLVLGALGVDSFTLGIADSPWTVYSFERSTAGFQANANPIGIGAASVALGCLYALARTPRTPSH